MNDSFKPWLNRHSVAAGASGPKAESMDVLRLGKSNKSSILQSQNYVLSAMKFHAQIAISLR